MTFERSLSKWPLVWLAHGRYSEFSPRSISPKSIRPLLRVYHDTQCKFMSIGYPIKRAFVNTSWAIDAAACTSQYQCGKNRDARKKKRIESIMSIRGTQRERGVGFWHLYINTSLIMSIIYIWTYFERVFRGAVTIFIYLFLYN